MRNLAKNIPKIQSIQKISRKIVGSQRWNSQNSNKVQNFKNLQRGKESQRKFYPSPSMRNDDLKQ